MTTTIKAKSMFVKATGPALKLTSVAEPQTLQTQILASLRSLGDSNPLDRIPDMDLIEDVLEFSKNSHLKHKLIQTITIYRNLLDMRQEFSSVQKKICDQAIDELENTFNVYLDTEALPNRTFRVMDILDPVAERQTHRT